MMSAIGLWTAVLKPGVWHFGHHHLILKSEVTIFGQKGGAGDDEASKPAMFGQLVNNRPSDIGIICMNGGNGILFGAVGVAPAGN